MAELIGKGTSKDAAFIEMQFNLKLRSSTQNFDFFYPNSRWSQNI